MKMTQNDSSGSNKVSRSVIFKVNALKSKHCMFFLRTFPHVTTFHGTTPIFSHHGKSGIFVVGLEVTKATVETDMLGNDFH